MREHQLIKVATMRSRFDWPVVAMLALALVSLSTEEAAAANPSLGSTANLEQQLCPGGTVPLTEYIRTISVNSEVVGHNASHLIDSDQSSWWQSAPDASRATIQVDFVAEVLLQQVQLHS